MSMETIVVTKNVAGKYGPQVLVGKDYISFSKFYKGAKELPVGVPVQVDLYVTEAGKKYINSVHTDTKDMVTRIELPKKKVEAAGTMSKQEWQDKDTRISRQGVIQVAVQVTPNFEEAVVLADKMLGYVNGGK